MKLHPRHGLVLAPVALAAVLSACGNAAAPVARSSTPTATSSTAAVASASSAPASDPSASSETGTSVTVDGRTVVDLPAGFPFPDGAKVDEVLVGYLSLSKPSGTEVVAYYRTALPDAGYQIDVDTGGDAAMLSWSGKGWTGTIVANQAARADVYWTRAQSVEPVTPMPQDPAPLNRVEVGLRNADLFMRFPPQTSLTVSSDTEQSVTATFDTPSPEQVLEFYTEWVASSVHNTPGTQTTVTGTTTMSWQTGEQNVVLTVSDQSATIAMTPLS